MTLHESVPLVRLSFFETVCWQAENEQVLFLEWFYSGGRSRVGLVVYRNCIICGSVAVYTRREYDVEMCSVVRNLPFPPLFFFYPSLPCAWMRFRASGQNWVLRLETSIGLLSVEIDHICVTNQRERRLE